MSNITDDIQEDDEFAVSINEQAHFWSELFATSSFLSRLGSEDAQLRAYEDGRLSPHFFGAAISLGRKARGVITLMLDDQKIS